MVLVTSISFLKLNTSSPDSLSFSKYIGRPIDARLHTANCSLFEYSIISVHRLLDLMVPRFFWFDLLLAASLKRRYGVPVSICDSSIANQSF